jgi:flagellar capping protein FliD
LRKTATAQASDTSLKLLANIGITTGKASTSTDTSSVNKLQLDEETFLDMLNEDPDGVKQLLLGDNKGNADSGGILNKLEAITENSLAATTGYFDAKSSSYSKQISALDTSISNAQSKVDSYQARLQKQFNNMETIISSIQSSYSQLSI